jgi:hypothetical protein
LTARAEVIAALSMICARCDGQMVVTRNAVGVERVRCPRCDGVAKVRHHPDEVLIPQGLVPASTLPPIAPGQLRCQWCARGVSGNARFCADACRVARHRQSSRRTAARKPRTDGSRAHVRWKPKPCEFQGCGAPFQPSGPNSRYCEAHR